MALRRISNLFVLKVLGIDVNNHHTGMPSNLDKRAAEVLDSPDVYLEDEPSVGDWFKEIVPSRRGVAEYITSLFPSASWIRRYNVPWLIGDMVAGTSPTLFDLDVLNVVQY